MSRIVDGVRVCSDQRAVSCQHCANHHQKVAQQQQRLRRRQQVQVRVAASLIQPRTQLVYRVAPLGIQINYFAIC